MCAAWSGCAPEHLSEILAKFESGLTSARLPRRFDISCRRDLVRDGAHLAFVAHLAQLAREGDGEDSDDADGDGLVKERDEQRSLAAFVLAAVTRGDRGARRACLTNRLDAALLDLLRRPARGAATARLRRWLLLCCGALCDGSVAARRAARRSGLAEAVARASAEDADAATRATERTTLRCPLVNVLRSGWQF